MRTKCNQTVDRMDGSIRVSYNKILIGLDGMHES